MLYDKNLYAVILAGGSGTRFWPLSRKNNPKQFLNVVGTRTLLQETLRRISFKILAQNIFVITNTNYADKVIKQLASFKVLRKNILLEPEGKNTAPAICWAALRIKKANPKATMIVLPSDHLILDSKSFLKIIDTAVKTAQKDYLVTLGIVPTHPETGYGYIKIKSAGTRGVCPVERFVEKPNLNTAKKFLKEKKYFWNSGMFIWKASVVLDEFKKNFFSMYHLLNGKTDSQIAKVWHTLPSISIDYGILEKAKDIRTVKAKNIGWSDLGSWEALMNISKKDKNGNVFKGKVLDLNCKNTFVFGQKRLVSVVGLKDIIVVDTPDALLVCRRDQSQKVKDIVAALKSQKLSKLL